MTQSRIRDRGIGPFQFTSNNTFITNYYISVVALNYTECLPAISHSIHLTLQARTHLLVSEMTSTMCRVGRKTTHSLTHTLEWIGPVNYDRTHARIYRHFSKHSTLPAAVWHRATALL